MPHRRRPVRTHRRLRLLLLLAGLGASPLAAGEPAGAGRPGESNTGAGKTGAEADGPGLTLQAPLNSTFQLGPPKRSWETEAASAGEAEAKTAALPAAGGSSRDAAEGELADGMPERPSSGESKTGTLKPNGIGSPAPRTADSGGATREAEGSDGRTRRLAIPRFASPTAVPRPGLSVAKTPEPVTAEPVTAGAYVHRGPRHRGRQSLRHRGPRHRGPRHRGPRHRGP